jgi:hypothetical protein
VRAGVQRDGEVVLVDADGRRLRTEPGCPRASCGSRSRTPVPATRRPRRAWRSTRRLPDELRRRVLAVSADDPDRVVLRLDGEQQVVWGAPGRDGHQGAAALALLRQPGGVVDVSTPGLVVRR